jgi:[methyl-Co(III) methanol-specific corrinoid protein]:coenzyme M methyltransferase
MPGMKPREIFLRSLRREPVPRPAVGSVTSIATVDLMHEVEAFFPAAHLDPEVMATLAMAGHTRLGFDNVMPLFSVWHESAALGCPVEWGEIDRMPDCRTHLCKVGDDIRIPKNLLTHPACTVPLQAIRLLRKRLGDEVAVAGKVFGPWTLGYHVFGVEEFLIHTLLEPDQIKRAMATLKEVTMAFGQAQIDAGADCLCLADHATRDLCSPDAYREFLQEVHAELVDRLNCPLVLHICGDTADRIDGIRQTGLACFHFDSKVPAEKARDLAGQRLALMGGTSNLEIIRKGSQEAIRQDVREKIAAGIDVIGPECAVPLDAPHRNMQVLAEEVKTAGARGQGSGASNGSSG